MNLPKQLIQEEDGQTYVEYGVLVALVVIIVAVSSGFVGTGIRDFFANISSSLDAVSVPLL